MTWGNSQTRIPVVVCAKKERLEEWEARGKAKRINVQNKKKGKLVSCSYYFCSICQSWHVTSKSSISVKPKNLPKVTDTVEASKLLIEHAKKNNGIINPKKDTVPRLSPTMLHAAIRYCVFGGQGTQYKKVFYLFGVPIPFDEE